MEMHCTRRLKPVSACEQLYTWRELLESKKKTICMGCLWKWKKVLEEDMLQELLHIFWSFRDSCIVGFLLGFETGPCSVSLDGLELTTLTCPTSSFQPP